MQDFEKLGVFYLGTSVSPETQKPTDTPLLYESKDLVTHGLCVGMTGSGKTGLCLGLLEEAAIDSIPSIVIDPKGDLSNLLLTFPSLQASDFRPWINESEASSAGVSPDDFAASQAEAWSKGLSASGQDGARIQRLKDSADFTIYTPGSQTGVSLSLLKSFSTPGKNILEDPELLHDRTSSTASSLLSLIGVGGDDLQSREHILLSNILEMSWQAGESFDLAGIIGKIQKPPFDKAGVLDLETFYPAKERFVLASSFNNLLASSSFKSWMSGEALDVSALLNTQEGKPRVSIISISHLSDSERMFVVSLLLNEVLSWIRTQSGTTSLRAIIYMDEIFGYFPPVANPPSKKPLLTLLKQARAYGLGLVLATQNPVDLDYKGLANIGTWFIGRLQTERDKARVLDGLAGAASEAQAQFDRASLDKILSNLGKRVFLLNNVHEKAPELFQTRWTLSYLRGPLTRDQIKSLMQAKKSGSAKEEGDSLSSASTQPLAAGSSSAPVLPPDVPQYFFPVTATGAIYQPVVVGAATLLYLDDKRGINISNAVMFTTLLKSGNAGVAWAAAEPADITFEELEREPEANSQFAALPAAATKAKSYTAWSKLFTTWLAQSKPLELFKSASLGIESKPNESERDFRVRLQQSAREQRDRLAEELKQRYAPKYAALEERKRRAEAAAERQKSQQSQAVLQSVVSVGSGLLGAFFGRKTLSATNLGRVATAARSVGRTWSEGKEIGHATENIEQLSQKLTDLQQQFEADLAAQQAKLDPANEQFEKVTIRLKKTNITVQLVGLGWKA